MEQSKALAILKAGHNIFLTGSAGSGKTYVLNQYIKYLKDRNVKVAITASTGIAATHMNGQTIHSWCGMGIKNKIGAQEVERMREKKYMVNKLDGCQVLIIDEVSMLHKRQLDMVNFILKRFRGTGAPFGGMQVILSGDFFQLPPVSRTPESNREKFAFMSQAWLEANLKVCYLTSQHRANNNALTIILDEIRNGAISDESKRKLLATKSNSLNGNLTELYTHNKNVDHVNNTFLQKIDQKQRTYKAEITGNLKMAEQIRGQVLAPEILTLKIGAKVMFVKNDPNGDYMNGSLGEVIDFYKNEDDDELMPKVKLNNGLTIYAQRDTWSIENEKAVAIVSYEQIPLRLGWAITVHKSQGMTLDAATIDLSNTFERGQGYVALSRLKDLSGLKLLGLNETALKVDELALKADFRFRELSQHVDIQYDENELAKSFKNFIERSGGTNNLNEVKKAKIKKKLKAKVNKNLKAKKISTYDFTKELIERKLSIHQISADRGFSESTVVNHIVNLKKKNLELDIEYLRPSETLLNKVFDAYDELKKTENKDHYTESGSFRLSVLYNFLDKEVPYEDLRLSMLFNNEN